MRFVKDKSGRVDGLSHVPYQLVAHLITTVISFSYGLYWIMIANWGVLIGMALYWLYAEIKQEKAMLKKYPTRQFTFSKSRQQDIGFPVVAGLIVCLTITGRFLGYY